MNYQISNQQVDFYQQNGFVLIEDFLSADELSTWRATVDEAVKTRNGLKFPGTMIKTGQDDGVNKEADYFGNVFDQLVNLWLTHEGLKKLMLDPRIGEMASKLSGAEGIRIWHDQALIKRPWANPTAWHLDTPFWSFDHPEALSIWIALDDATMANGCLYFLPGSHRQTGYKETAITKNMNAIFQSYPSLTGNEAVAVPMKAGSASFHNGLCIHGAGANMTPGYRRAMTCAFMPEGSRFNGKKNILSEEYINGLHVGDLLNDDHQNPLIFERSIMD